MNNICLSKKSIISPNNKNTVYIIGGGNSLKSFNFNLLKDKNTIVINKAIEYVETPTYFITMDYTFLNKIDLFLFKKKKCTKFFVLSLTKNSNVVFENGKIIDKKFNLPYKNLNLFDIIIITKKDKGIGNTWNDFRNGINSGFCAIQLALLLNYKKIILLGFDFCIIDNKTHFHDGYNQSSVLFEKKLIEYKHYFNLGMEEIKLKYPDVIIERKK